MNRRRTILPSHADRSDSPFHVTVRSTPPIVISSQSAKLLPVTVSANEWDSPVESASSTDMPPPYLVQPLIFRRPPSKTNGVVAK